MAVFDFAGRTKLLRGSHAARGLKSHDVYVTNL